MGGCDISTQGSWSHGAQIVFGVLDSDVLQGLLHLFENKYAFLEVQDFVSEEECQELLQGLQDLGFQQYRYNFDLDKAPPATHVFTQHYFYESQPEKEGAEAYFLEAAKSNQLYHDFVSKSKCDPAAMVFALLQEYLGIPVQIAEQNGQQYSYVIARELSNSALLHADFANFIPHYWSISNIKAEYAWNVYLTDPGEGGELISYNKQWEKTDDAFIIQDTYGYDHKVIEGAEVAHLKPKPRSLVLFNSRNFHEVNASTKPRVGIGGHLGLTPDNSKFLAWV